MQFYFFKAMNMFIKVVGAGEMAQLFKSTDSSSREPGFDPSPT